MATPSYNQCIMLYTQSVYYTINQENSKVYKESKKETTAPINVNHLYYTLQYSSLDISSPRHIFEPVKQGLIEGLDDE